MEGKIVAIHKALAEINEVHEKEIKRINDNREAAIKMVRFISDTIKNSAPGEIDAYWMGSFSNPQAVDYPCVTVYATMTRGRRDLAHWKVNCSGKFPPTRISQEDIIGTIQQKLAEMEEAVR